MDVPETHLPERALGFRVQVYGMTRHRDLFTRRQLVALTTFSDLVAEARNRAIADGASKDYANAIATYLGLAVSRSANTINSLCVWSQSRDQSVNLFSRQAIPMAWDFPEVNPFAGAAGDFAETTQSMAKTIASLPANVRAQVQQTDATTIDTQKMVFSTDPPYYDNIGYADLSDFFYVWLRHSLREALSAIDEHPTMPKKQELVATPYRFDGGREEAQKFFEDGFGKAMRQIRANQESGLPRHDLLCLQTVGKRK